MSTPAMSCSSGGWLWYLADLDILMHAPRPVSLFLAYERSIYLVWSGICRKKFFYRL